MLDEDKNPVLETIAPWKDSVRRWLVRSFFLAVAFLLGFAPMWVSNWETSTRLMHSRVNLRLSELENELAAAAIHSCRGEYEAGRRDASTFFSELQSELGKADLMIFTEQERIGFANLLSGRDDVITLLSRGDPASADRLFDLYVAFRSSKSGTRVSQ